MGDSATDRRAVVVEDDDDMRILLARTLQRHGFDVVEADTGADGLRLVREHSPDLVTLDLNLPDLDGTEVCRRLREFSDAYVIMITGRGDEIDELTGLQIGADDYISKPFSPRRSWPGPRGGCGRGKCCSARCGATSGPRMSIWSRSMWAICAGRSAIGVGIRGSSARCAASVRDGRTVGLIPRRRQRARSRSVSARATASAS